MFIYAITNGSNLFQFAARNADSLGEDASAVSIVGFGEQTLSHADGVGRAARISGADPQEPRCDPRAAPHPMTTCVLAWYRSAIPRTTLA